MIYVIIMCFAAIAGSDCKHADKHTFQTKDECIAFIDWAYRESNRSANVTSVDCQAEKSPPEPTMSDLKLKAFSADVGFSVDQIKSLYRAMSDAGKSDYEIVVAISKLGDAYRDIQLNRWGAAPIREINMFGPGWHDFAGQLLAFAESSRSQEFLDLLLKKWKLFSDRQRFAIARAFYMSPSEINAMEDAF